MLKQFKNEGDYQGALLSFLRRALAGHKLWALKGQPASYLGRVLYPDIEIDEFGERKLQPLAIVELKLDAKIDPNQPLLYAFSKNTPFYCAVDGFRRTPVKWRYNERFMSTDQRMSQLSLMRLKIIKHAIEQFNVNNFI